VSARARRSASERWFRLLLHCYPPDFRDEMGASLVETYLDRCRTVAAQSKGWRIAAVWVRALADSVLNGIAERLRPGVRWRRAGNWGRDTELAVRRLKRAPAFSLAMLGTLIVGLGGFAVVLTVIDKTLIEPLPYERPHDLYFVWRDLSTITDIKRGWVGGPDVADLGKAGGPIVGSVGLRLDRRTFADTRSGDGNPEELSVMISSPNLSSASGGLVAMMSGARASSATSLARITGGLSLGLTSTSVSYG